MEEKRFAVRVGEYWAEFWPLFDKHPMNIRTEYTDVEFCDALALYRNQSIQESLRSENPLVRMFAVLDRRVGKRTLERLEVEKQPAWLRQFYQVRLDAEKIQ